MHKTLLKFPEKKECAFAVPPAQHGSMLAASLVRALLLQQILSADERNSLPVLKGSESTSYRVYVVVTRLLGSFRIKRAGVKAKMIIVALHFREVM